MIGRLREDGVLRARAAARPLGPSERTEVLDLLDRDPVTHVFVASRVRAFGLSRSRLGGDLWGFGESGRLVSLCYAGANLVPVAATRSAVRAFADLLSARPRRCSSMVGEADAVLSMWDLLRSDWAPARDVRACQPLLALDHRPHVPADPQVRRVRPSELGRLLPAAVAMFTEEVGVSPVRSDGGAYYRARVSELVDAGRAFARFEDGQVVFKAEIGSVTPYACQVQGVWVRPERRGEGLSVAGTAAVVEHALRDIAPVVSLYVNDYNIPARSAYRRVGFRQVGEFATVLF